MSVANHIVSHKTSKNCHADFDWYGEGDVVEHYKMRRQAGNLALREGQRVRWLVDLLFFGPTEGK